MRYAVKINMLNGLPYVDKLYTDVTPKKKKQALHEIYIYYIYIYEILFILYTYIYFRIMTAEIL